MTPDQQREQAERIASRLPPLVVEAERIASSMIAGLHGRRRVGSGEAFWQYRHYGFGDPAHRIDWRQSGKSDHVFIREKEVIAPQSVWLWCDQSPSMNYTSGKNPTKRERAQIVLLALSVLLVRGEERVGLFGYDTQPRRGFYAVNHLAESLQLTEDRHSLPQPYVLPQNSQMVLFGDFLNNAEDVSKAIAHFSNNHVSGQLVQILDPAEMTLPFTGRVRFYGMEGEGEDLVPKTEALREEYQQKIAAHQDALRAVAKQYGWNYHLHLTSDDPVDVLFRLYFNLSHHGNN